MSMNEITLWSSIKYSFGVTFGSCVGIVAAGAFINWITNKSKSESQEEES